MKYQIRKAKKKDLKEICDVVAEGKVDEERMQYPKKKKTELEKQFDDAKKIWMKKYKKEIGSKNDVLFVAEVEGKIVGVAKVLIEKKRGELERLYLLRKYRGFGIGKALTKFRVDYLKKKGVKWIDTYIYVKNKKSLKLHEDLGFKYGSYRMEMNLK